MYVDEKQNFIMPIVVPMSEPRKLLERAIDLLVYIGWTRGTEEEWEENELDHLGLLRGRRLVGFCTVGAINAASNPNADLSDQTDVVMVAIQAEVNDWEITEWNDDKVGSIDEIIGTLTYVAEKL